VFQNVEANSFEGVFSSGSEVVVDGHDDLVQEGFSINLASAQISLEITKLGSKVLNQSQIVTIVKVLEEGSKDNFSLV